jgi:hypothetical protein
MSDNIELLTRLFARRVETTTGNGLWLVEPDKDCADAADEITRLRARIQQLEAALTKIDEINVESDHYQTAINRVIEAALPASNAREGTE